MAPRRRDRRSVVPRALVSAPEPPPRAALAIDEEGADDDVIVTRTLTLDEVLAARFSDARATGRYIELD